MSDIELKPCPFCGGPVSFNYNLELEPDGIQCRRCHTILRFTRIRVQGSEKFGVSMGKMADIWNRRTDK